MSGSGSSSGSGVGRVWGSCSKHCLYRSKVYRLEHCGVDRVSFNFKHWCIYLETRCEVHGNQRWTVEKELEGGHAKEDYQCFWNHCIVMWCGYYKTYLCTENSRNIQNGSLVDAYNTAMQWEHNGYNWMNDNCATFVNEYDRKLPF